MAITDIDQLDEVSWRLVENDPTFPSGLWTVAEIAAAFNDRQNRFNRDTKLLLAHQPIAATSGTAQYTLPDDWIATQRVTWTDTPTGRTTPMDRSDRYAAQHGIAPSGVGAPSRPTTYDDHSGGTLTVEVFPTPATDGTLGLLYASTLSELHFDSGTPDLFDTPDEFVPYITYGVLADLLMKDGRGQNRQLAAYCESRYTEGVALAALLLAGFLS